MRQVTMYQTFDGQRFPSVRDARKHLDHEYTNRVSDLAAGIARLDKYQQIKDYIDLNLQRFVDAMAYKEDMVLDNPDEEV